MYGIEKFLYQDQISDSEESKRHWRETIEKYGGDAKLIRETGFDGAGNKIYHIHDSVSDTPRAVGSVYVQNDRYIDLCTSFEDKRGILTMLAVFTAIWGIGMPIFVITEMIPDLIRGTWAGSGDPLGFSGYLAGVFGILLACVLFPVFIYLTKRFFRLEIFVQRRLLVRFDRVNRKVYLHRPRYAGGVVALDWDKIMPEVGKDGVSAIGMPLCLCWENADTPHGLAELVFAGRLARGNMEIRERWEFIRRFMEDGPQAVPQQKTLGKCPWPWVSVKTVLGFIWPLFHMASLRWMLPLVLLFSPAILVFAAANWLSLLLCWEPVFPRAIRRACGERWWDVAKTRIADLTAWTMLALLLIWLWPSLRQMFAG